MIKNDLEDTIYTFQVSDSEEGQRLDKFLAQKLQTEHLSRERIQALIASGCVQVNRSKQTKVSTSLYVGETVCLTVPPSQPVNILAENIALDVIYEDDHLLIVNKPSGMLTHPNGRVQQGTLVNALLGYCGDRLSGINGFLRPGIVHRLDRDTCGLLMVAKTDQAHHNLSAQLKAKTVRRQYQAVVQGVINPPTGTVVTTISRHPVIRDKMMVSSPDKGRHAVTHWQTIRSIGNRFSLLELALETGRTHQIRVHMAHLGHPLVADPQYGTGLEKIIKLQTQGQLLQAFRLHLLHPVSQKECCFEIPQAEKLASAIQLLEQWVCNGEALF